MNQRQSILKDHDFVSNASQIKVSNSWRGLSLVAKQIYVPFYDTQDKKTTIMKLIASEENLIE